MVAQSKMDRPERRQALNDFIVTCTTFVIDADDVTRASESEQSFPSTATRAESFYHETGGATVLSQSLIGMMSYGRDWIFGEQSAKATTKPVARFNVFEPKQQTGVLRKKIDSTYVSENVLDNLLEGMEKNTDAIPTIENFARQKTRRWKELGLEEDEKAKSKDGRPGNVDVNGDPSKPHTYYMPSPTLTSLAFAPLLYKAYLWPGLFATAGTKTVAGGVYMAMVPPAASPAVTDNGFSIANLLCPDFKGDTFLKRMVVLQCLEYVGSLCLTMGSNMASEAARNGGGIFGFLHPSITQLVASPNTCSMYLLGASWGPSIAAGEIWRLITPVMLHANGLHIFFNMFFQSRVGFAIEEQIGTRKFIILYFFCGFFGNLVSLIVDPMKLAVGASTSAFGLLGVWFAEIHLTWHLLSEETRSRLSFWFAGMLAAVIIMSAIAPHIDLWGHVGGLAGGYLISIIMADMREEYKPTWYDDGQKYCQMIVAWTTLLGLGKLMFRTPTSPIPDCGSLLHPKSTLEYM